jgi:hypothetical protein
MPKDYGRVKIVPLVVSDGNGKSKVIHVNLDDWYAGDKSTYTEKEYWEQFSKKEETLCIGAQPDSALVSVKKAHFKIEENKEVK